MLKLLQWYHLDFFMYTNHSYEKLNNFETSTIIYEHCTTEVWQNELQYVFNPIWSDCVVTPQTIKITIYVLSARLYSPGKQIELVIGGEKLSIVIIICLQTNSSNFY